MRGTSLTSGEASEGRPCRLPEGLPRRWRDGRGSDDERHVQKKENNKTRRDGFVYSAAPKVEAIRRD